MFCNKVVTKAMLTNGRYMDQTPIKKNSSWHRTRLSKEICDLWNWKRPDGSLKDMACRTMLLKLEKRKFLKQLISKQHETYITKLLDKQNERITRIEESISTLPSLVKEFEELLRV